MVIWKPWSARALSALATLGVAAATLAASAGPVSAAVTCPTVDPVTHAVSPAPGPGADLQGCVLANANLFGADLTGANLAGADMTGATLTAARLVSADLTGANLASTALGGASLDGATLTMVRSGGITGNPTVLPANWVLATSLAGGYLAGPGADFSGQNLMGVNFNPGPGGPSADLAGADFAGATVRSLGGDNLTGANLTGANLRGANFYGSDLTNADFSNADLTGGTLSVTTLTGTILGTATLTGIAAWGLTGTPASLPANWSIRDSCLIGPGAVLPAASLTGSDLSGADLAGADLAGAFMASSNLTGTNLTGADLTGADLTSANLTKADLTTANLTGATVAGATWTSVTWSGTTCPDGSNSDSHVAGCFSASLYGFGGFISPVPGSTLARSAKTIAATFRLTGAGGKPIAAALAAKLARGHKVRVTLSGPLIKPVNVYCAWKSTKFSCVIKIPAGVGTGTADPYQITATENLGTGFKKAPIVGQAVNPETIYFK
jgi:uncharacterized protein YjbI with pentapeptide repeats